MSKNATKQENIVERKESAVPVEPSLRQFNKYGVTPPSDFALYKTSSNTQYDLEIQRVTNELRQEVFYSNDEEEVQKLTEEVVEVKTQKTRKCNIIAILIFLASVAIIALYIVGKYIVAPIATIPSLLLITDKSGLGVIFDLINVFLKGSEIEIVNMAMQIAVVATVAMSIIILLSSVFIMRRQGIGKAMKTSLVLHFTFTVVIAVMFLINKGTLPVGYYILFGLSFISMVCGIFTKGVAKEKEVKK